MAQSFRWLGSHAFAKALCKNNAIHMGHMAIFVGNLILSNKLTDLANSLGKQAAKPLNRYNVSSDTK